MGGKVWLAYEARIVGSELEADSAQAEAAARLDRLAVELESRQSSSRVSMFSTFWRNRAQSAPRGLYLQGAVGRGKTMLMDLFFENVAFTPKRRLHFHEFMAETHERIARGRATTDGDPIPFVAGEIAAQAQLLCFDELQVNDIADAMILGRLFRGILERGVVIVATSNAALDRLYWNGLNRPLFLPFIELLQKSVDELELRSAKDFRLDKLAGRQLYFCPADAWAERELDQHWDRLTGRHPAASMSIEVLGRQVHVPLASMGVARFMFDDVCGKPLGGNDYLHIAHAFNTVLIEGIPKLTPDRRNEARRLIMLIDALYDQRVCLIASAEAEPQDLYPAGDGAAQFERTVSRLMEMRSEAYLSRRAPNSSDNVGLAHTFPTDKA